MLSRVRSLRILEGIFKELRNLKTVPYPYFDAARCQLGAKSSIEPLSCPIEYYQKQSGEIRLRTVASDHEVEPA